MNKGHVVLPKSVTATRIAENLKVVKLDSSDMDALEKIHKDKGITRFVYPAFGVSLVMRLLLAKDILTVIRSTLDSQTSRKAAFMFNVIYAMELIPW